MSYHVRLVGTSDVFFFPQATHQSHSHGRRHVPLGLPSGENSHVIQRTFSGSESNGRVGQSRWSRTSCASQRHETTRCVSLKRPQRRRVRFGARSCTKREVQQCIRRVWRQFCSSRNPMGFNGLGKHAELVCENDFQISNTA